MESEGRPTASLAQMEPSRPDVFTRIYRWFTCWYDPARESPATDDGRPMPSLDLGLELMRDNLSLQMSQADAIDTKAGLVLGSSSFVTGVLVAWHRLPIASPAPIQWLPDFAIGVYCIVVILSAIAYSVREYGLSPDPTKMRDKYLFLDRADAQDEVFHGMVIAWLRNSRTIGTKLHWFQAAFIAFGVQIAVVAAIIFVEVATINASP